MKSVEKHLVAHTSANKTQQASERASERTSEQEQCVSFTSTLHHIMMIINVNNRISLLAD